MQVCQNKVPILEDTCCRLTTTYLGSAGGLLNCPVASCRLVNYCISLFLNVQYTAPGHFAISGIDPFFTLSLKVTEYDSQFSLLRVQSVRKVSPRIWHHMPVVYL